MKELKKRLAVLKNKYKNQMTKMEQEINNCNRGFTGMKQAQFLGGRLSEKREVYADLCYLSDALPQEVGE